MPPKSLAERRKQLAIDFKIVDGTEHGRRVMDYLLEYCHVLQPSMMADLNTNAMVFNEGQRSVGLEIASLLSNEPARFAMKRMIEAEESND